MKKFNLLLLISAFLLVLSLTNCTHNNSPYQTTLEQDNLKGKVKRINKTTYALDIKFGKEKRGEKKYNSDFDNAVFLYDSLGNLSLTECCINYKNEHITCNFHYDKQHLLSSIEKKQYKHTNESVVFHRDKKGHIIRCKEYVGSNCQKKYLYKYDGDNEVSSKEYDGDSHIDSYTEKKYNFRNLKTKEISYYGSGKVGEVTTYTYNLKGLNTQEKTVDRDGDLRSKSKYDYNRHGDLSKIKCYNRKNKLEDTYVFKYEYDKEGNWIDLKAYVNGEPYKEVTRIIDYYNI